ncbi:MAG: DUF6159 family protein [Methanoregula sp.]|jgi:hypothetical protein|nr:DUF6159 family protein [Methanoregula sp.]
MTTRISEIFHEWMGWCPNATTKRTAPTAIAIPPVTITPSRPDNGAGGSGRLDRGVNLALGSLQILIWNGRLLWFSILTGLLLVFSLAATFGLQYLSGINPVAGFGLDTGTLPVLVAKGSALWLTLTFTSQFVFVFCSAILLAGLITSVSFLFAGRTALVREGLTSAGNHLLPIAGWSAVYATVATLQSVVVYLFPENLFLAFIAGIFFLPLGFITLFVIPLIVLEERDLASAVRESLSLIRKTWGETLLGFFVYIVIWFVVAIITLIPAAAIGFPSGNPQLMSLSMALYLLALMIMMMIYSTAVGIFLVGLYSYAKTGRIPAQFEGKQVVKVPA